MQPLFLSLPLTHTHLRFYIIEGVEFEAKPDFVIFLDALLHETS